MIEAATAEEARRRWSEASLVLLDLQLTRNRDDRSGLRLLGQKDPRTPPFVFVMSGHDQVAEIYPALQRGALDFFAKAGGPPSALPVLDEAAVRSLVELYCTRPPALAALIGSSDAMAALRQRIERLGRATGSVMIRGEPGTGKELVARALHASSDRRDGDLIALNTGALGDGLSDSTLFGHVEGAFTGALRDRVGAFCEANGGTLFLDEIGDMPLAQQVKLLRVLETGLVRPLGASKDILVDVRVIAATNVDLESAVADGRFRRDLFYRLTTLSIEVPPLRARGRNDVHELVDHFSADRLSFTAAAREWLAGYEWPGNVRELDSMVKRLIALRAGVLDVADLEGEAGRRPGVAKTTNDVYRDLSRKGQVGPNGTKHLSRAGQ